MSSQELTSPYRSELRWTTQTDRYLTLWYALDDRHFIISRHHSVDDHWAIKHTLPLTLEEMIQKGTEPFIGDLHVDITQWSSAECGMYNGQLQVITRNVYTSGHTHTHSFSLSFVIKPNVRTLLKCNYQTLNMSHATSATPWRRNIFCGKEVKPCKRED